MKSLDSLSLGFRQRYLDFAELTAQLRAWAEAFPEIAHLQSIGKSREGRDLWVLVVGRDPQRPRPAVWVDANMHASELCGTNVALGIAEEALRFHLEPRALPQGVTAPLRPGLEDVLFYVMPRMAPDGAEALLKTGRYVRSSPGEGEPRSVRPRWRWTDLDGDGLALWMRKQDPLGEFVESAEHPGLMLPRSIEDAGPFYKLYPEGVIEHFDGATIPAADFLPENGGDINRNFPHAWVPDPEQMGAGQYPMSEPECRAVVEFTSRLPQLFAWLNLHSFAGVFIRPSGSKPDAQMDPSELALYTQIGAWCEALAGYPMVSAFEEFTYVPGHPWHGDVAQFAYHERGAIAYTCELHDIFKQLGCPRPRRFVDHYNRLTREDFIKFAQWDRQHNEGRCIKAWKPFKHPQLGAVELGGFDPRVGLWNPPPEQLDGLCRKQSAAFLRVAALAPRLSFGEVVTRKSEGVTQIDVWVENHGFLPTHVLASSRRLPWNKWLEAHVELDGCSLLSASQAVQTVPHLDGWGRGMNGEGGSLAFLFGRGNTGQHRIQYQVTGKGTLTVRVGGQRTGWIVRRVEIQ